MTVGWFRSGDAGSADRPHLAGTAGGDGRPAQTVESSGQVHGPEHDREQLERRCALFLVVLCVLCCVWVHEGAVELERRVVDRRTKLEQFNRLRSAVRSPAATMHDLTALDGLFPGRRILVRDTAAGPALMLVPAIDPREE